MPHYGHYNSHRTKTAKLVASFMSNIPISVFIITLNEAEHIAEVIKSAKHFDEIVLVDSGSTDDTVEIAKSLGAKVFHQPWLGFAKQKSHAMSLCQNEWVFNLDGDEVLPVELAETVQTMVNEDKADALRIYFEDIFWGNSMSPHSAKRSIVRVYKKHKVQFPLNRLVHENVVLEKGAVEAKVPGRVTHYGYGSTRMLMDKQNSYSSLKSQEKFNKGKRPSLVKLVLIFPVYFIKCYLFRKMFLSGRRGLVHAMIESMYAFLKEAKLFELYYRQK